MNRNKGIFVGSTVIPAAIGILALVIVVFIMGPTSVEVSGAEFYNVQSVTGEKVVGSFLGPISNGDVVTDDDVVNITAINSSTPSPVPTDDVLVIDLIVNNSAGENQYQTSWSLTYNGTGAEFTGNITIDVDLAQNFQSSSDGIHLKADDGYMVTVRKNGSSDAPLLYFMVDGGGPSISPVEPGASIATYSGETYARSGGKVNLSISDVSSDQQWFVDNSKVTYKWDGGTSSTWDGNAITIPSSFGNHTLNVTAVDLFDQSTTFLKTYNVTHFLSDPNLPNDMTINSGLVFITTTNIVDGLNLTIRNAEVVFLNYDDELTVEDGGSLIIKNCSISSKADQYTIASEEGADLNISDTEIFGPDLSSSDSSILSLKAGRIFNVTFHDITNMISILSQGVEFTHSNIELDGPGTINIDMKHTWDSTPTNLMNLTINSTSWTPIQISNVSTWQPYDVNTRYYEDDTSGTVFFYIDTSNMTNPYLKLPRFIDSRAPTGLFDFEYNNSGIWTSFSGFPVGNVVYDEWMNGDDAKVNLSGLAEGPYQLRATWTAPSDDVGCIYLGDPILGGDGLEDIIPGSPSFSIDLSNWGTQAQGISGYALVLRNISVYDATSNFMYVESSGDVMASELVFGEPGASVDVDELILLVNSSVTISDSDLVGSDETEYGVKVTFDAGNDWGTSYLHGLDLSINGTSVMDAGIYSKGGWLDAYDVNVHNCTFGIRVNNGFLNSNISVLDPDDTGISIIIPSSYPLGTSMTVYSTSAGDNYEVSGFYLEGTAIDYAFNITLEGFDFSTSNDTSYTRGDGIGGVTLDLTSSKIANALISGNVTRGRSHGIAVPNWPSQGEVSIIGSRITTVSLDGIYLGDGLLVNITDVSISQSNVGIYAGDDIKIVVMGATAKSTIANTGSGGIMLGDNSEFHIEYFNISISNGPGFLTGTASSGKLLDVEMYRCRSGITIGDGSNVEIFGLDVDYKTLGYGLFARNSDIVIGKGNDIRWNYVTNGNGDGFMLEGGSLNISRVLIASNSGEGMNLWGVDLLHMQDVKIVGNSGNGLSIHVTSDSLLDSNGHYADIINTDVKDNSGTGLVVTFDPTQVTKVIELGLKGPDIGGNPGGDVISPKLVHITWTSEITGRDRLGSNTVTGVVRANLDVVLMEAADAEIRNLNITLLGNSNSFHVFNSGTLRLSNCYIRPSQTEHRFSLIGDELSTIQIIGGYLGQLYRLEMDGGQQFSMDGTLVRFGSGPIMLDSTPMLIMDSEFSKIEGTALLVIDGEGTIQGTKFTENTIGLQVEGLDDDLDVIDCEFVDNNWGIFLFNDSAQDVSIVDSYFSGNSPAPIWTATANAYLLDTFIDPYSIQVTQAGYSVKISYTLEIELLNEINDNVKFDLTVNRGPGLNIVNHGGIDSRFTDTYESYKVVHDDVVDEFSTIEITLRYQEGSNTAGDPIMAEIEDTFDLTRAISITYYGYQAPRKTGKFPGDLIALEDIGLKDNTVDVEPWFKDIGSDVGNLTFSAQSYMPEITPIIDGSILSLALQKDWNGNGNITVTATDPHGVSLSLDVRISVLGRNDQPSVKNPRIIALNSESPTLPRTHDTIKGVWEWFDMDGDNEPLGHIMRWFLNGTHMPDHDNKITVENVYAGQIWNFTIYPADNLGISGGTYGEPAHSPPVMIGNIPPRLDSATITTLNPTTLTDLMVSPGNWGDPETNVVTFNYLWMRKVSTGYESIGAPNSPILDHRFTRTGDTIRVKVWVSDGLSVSEVRTAEIYIRNSPPYIESARLMPAIVDENTERIYIEDLVWGDPDSGDVVTISYQWYVRGYPIAISDVWSELQKSEGNWNYPANISVGITPYDSNNLPGVTYYLSVYITPTDTDGDGKLDDANGNGENDLNDDKDDDGDGFEDEWEQLLGTNPKDRFDQPLDTDGDGIPDGNPQNSKDWMDLDDDNDRIWDIHPDNANMNDPIWFDTFPKIASKPGDMDHDGIGDDQDPDIDGDEYLNEEDEYPLDPNRHKEPEIKENFLIQGMTLFLVFLIIVAIGAFVYLVYNGTITLPTQAPPPVSDSSAEAIYDEEPGVAKLPPKMDDVEEMEELDGMSTCSNCGDIVSLDEPMCPNCGAEFEDDVEEDEEEMDFDEDYEE